MKKILAKIQKWWLFTFRNPVEYEFEFDFNKGEEFNQDIFDFIVEDSSKSIEDAFNDIIEGINKVSYRVVQL